MCQFLPTSLAWTLSGCVLKIRGLLLQLADALVPIAAAPLEPRQLGEHDWDVREFCLTTGLRRLTSHIQMSAIGAIFLTFAGFRQAALRAIGSE
jgi:hypothetical protein